MRYLYHVTKRDNVPRILREGLLPAAGRNALSAGDAAPGVYLCERRQAAVWALVLDADAFVKVRTDGLDALIMNDYDSLREYVSYGSIAPERLSPCDVPLNPHEASRTCKSYVMCASENTVTLLRMLARKRQDKATIDALNATIRNIAGILDRLPWEHANPGAILKALKHECSQGEYTMCDTYMDTGRKFWECLDDPRIPAGPQLKAVLAEKLGPDFPSLCTGGWDGPEEDE